MVEKRFVIKPSSIVNDGFVIIDKEKDYTFPVLESTLNYMFCKALNELHEENERLHNEIFRLRTIMAYDRTVDSIFEGMAKTQREQVYPLKEEGKQYRS